MSSLKSIVLKCSIFNDVELFTVSKNEIIAVIRFIIQPNKKINEKERIQQQENEE